MSLRRRGHWLANQLVRRAAREPDATLRSLQRMKFRVMALSCRSKSGLADLAFRVVVVEVSTVRSGARFRPLKFRFNAANSAKVGLSVTCLACSDQNTDRQLDGVTLDRIFEIKRADRTLAPALQEMLAYVRHGKTVMVHWYVLNLWPSVTAVREVASPGAKNSGSEAGKAPNSVQLVAIASRTADSRRHSI